MKKNKYFTFRVSEDDQQYLAELARLLFRNKADAVRYAIRRAVFQLRFPAPTAGDQQSGDVLQEAINENGE